ncbi:hypothetical protein ACJX0J_032240, partial [Zea mays]
MGVPLRWLVLVNKCKGICHYKMKVHAGCLIHQNVGTHGVFGGAAITVWIRDRKGRMPGMRSPVLKLPVESCFSRKHRNMTKKKYRVFDTLEASKLKKRKTLETIKSSWVNVNIKKSFTDP